MGYIQPQEIKVGTNITFYKAPHEYNYCWNRPSDNQALTGYVSKVEDGVIHLSRKDAYWIDGAIHGHSWKGLDITIEEAQKAIDDGLAVIWEHDPPARTWT